MNIHEKLVQIQSELKAPKNHFNSFGNYHYRNCEDILEGLKPLLDKHKATLIVTDDLVMIGERYYIKATSTLIDVETGDEVSATGFAREEENKKGMDSMQLSGATGSYARKYSLNGLFAIDDTKDSDATNKHGKGEDDNNNNNSSNEEYSTSTVIPFGKYKGKTLGEVLKEDKSYIKYLSQKSRDDGMRKFCTELLLVNEK